MSNLTEPGGTPRRRWLCLVMRVARMGLPRSSWRTDGLVVPTGGVRDTSSNEDVLDPHPNPECVVLMHSSRSPDDPLARREQTDPSTRGSCEPWARHGR